MSFTSTANRPQFLFFFQENLRLVEDNFDRFLTPQLFFPRRALTKGALKQSELSGDCGVGFLTTGCLCQGHSR